MLGDLSEPHDQAPFGLGLGGVLLVDSLLETNQFLQEQSDALVDLLTQHLVTVPVQVKRRDDGGKKTKQNTHNNLTLLFSNNQKLKDRLIYYVTHIKEFVKIVLKNFDPLERIISRGLSP